MENNSRPRSAARAQVVNLDEARGRIAGRIVREGGDFRTAYFRRNIAPIEQYFVFAEVDGYMASESGQGLCAT